MNTVTRAVSTVLKPLPKAEEDHPDKKVAGGFFGPGHRSAERSARHLEKHHDENAEGGETRGEVGDNLTSVPTSRSGELA